MDLVRLVYKVTGGFPKSEVFGLTSQMRRAAVSVPSNIAEGQGLGTEKQFCHSLFHARGSLYELHTEVELAIALNYLEAEQGATLTEECASLAGMMNALIRPLQEP